MTRTKEYGFMVYLSAEEKKALEQHAEKEGWSQSQVVREALKKYLKK